MRYLAHWLGALALALIVSVVGCGRASDAREAGDVLPTLTPVALAGGERLRVVATTSIVADVASRVGGDAIDLTRLIPVGVDPHSFPLRPQDIAAVSDAHVLVTNGLGLEEFLPNLRDATGGAVPEVPVSAGVTLREFQADAAPAPAAAPTEGEEEHAGPDPHTWFDVQNVIQWTRNIEQALSALDPAHAEEFAANAAAYRAELEALDAWIRETVATIPEERRLLVTDHTTFTHLAGAYGLRQVGALIPSYSTVAEPSARELTALQEAIRQVGAPAVFVGTTVNPRLAETLARDAGIRVVFLYTGSLSEPTGPAATYLEFMRYNVSAIADALRS